MKVNEIILYLIEFLGGKIKGKTLLQKLIYFISIFEDKEFGYSAYYYGPFSSKVESELSQMISLGFLNQEVFYYGEDSYGFDVKGYEYSLTSDGKEILNYYKKINSNNYDKIKHDFELMKDYIEINDINHLSIAAKTYHILREKNIEMSSENIKIEAKKLGWHISERQIDKACEFLAKLKLIQFKSN